MPFADEAAAVAVLEYQSQWPVDFERLAGELYKALGNDARAIDHVGSTAVPGLAAKDCVDIQVRVDSIQEARQIGLLAAMGFRCRPEPWNRAETSGGQECRKLVFAPPVGARSCSVHLREDGAPNCRFALLFRDYLRADEAARREWGAFKRRLARSVPDLLDYGQIKAPATEILMIAAESWAAATGWQPPPGRTASRKSPAS
ncbi:GrpB family protein [Streptomyces sp. NPDC059832]|uniref:GrpB family protein n=1 Tax=Streptomyces sp. NPDC059832 TaxID=3346966 RepID=UPI003655B98B